jgi:serine/threonine protein kinase
MSERLIGERYEVECEVGRGGMGVVFRARDIRLGRTVALKMLRADMIREPDRRRRLSQEARAASALSHPHLATVFDYEDRGDEAYIVYEFVEGATLRETLRGPRWTTKMILRVATQLADALASAHEHGVVHRDLKPENIMLRQDSTEPGSVKILDFGLAKIRKPIEEKPAGSPEDTVSVSTAAGALVGTVNYMAPEQLEGELADGRTDIFALGLVLYELATGVNPFVGKTASSTIANILKQEISPVRNLNPVAPPEFDRILLKCLRKRREERYFSARELLVDLTHLAHEASPSEVSEKVSASWPAPEAPGIVPPGPARILFGLIQAGYLLMYGIALYKLDEVNSLSRRWIGGRAGEGLYVLILMCALVGTPVRLYLMSALFANYADTGRKFRLLFPFMLLLDLVWALSPLLLFHKFRGLILAFSGMFAYLPFAARRLLFEVYSSRGGRTSDVGRITRS